MARSPGAGTEYSVLDWGCDQAMRLYWIVIRDTVYLEMEGRATIFWFRGPPRGTL